MTNEEALKEAAEVLALIDMEFRSDPMSVQCFDLSIVLRTRAVVGLLEHYAKGA